MHDDRVPQTGDQGVAEIAAELAAVRRRLDSLEAENRRLRDAAVRPAPTGAPAPLSRRAALKGMAAGVAGAAGASALAGAPVAGAATGDAVLAGSVTTTENATIVKYDGPSRSSVVLLGSDYQGAGDPYASYPAALGGWAGGVTPGIASGVYGFANVADGQAIVALENSSGGTGRGLLALSNNGTALHAVNGDFFPSPPTTRAAVVAEGRSGAAVIASSTGSGTDAVRATNSGGGHAIRGFVGNAPASTGITASAVVGEAGGTARGVLGRSSAGTAVHGKSNSGIALAANSATGYGAALQGGRAPLRLTPSTKTGAPTSGAHNLGEFWVDSAGHLYYCTHAGTGTGATWKQLA